MRLDFVQIKDSSNIAASSQCLSNVQETRPTYKDSMVTRLHKKWVCAVVWLVVIYISASFMYKNDYELRKHRVYHRIKYTKPELRFDERFKNPCWVSSNGTQPLTCVPYFYVPGFGKSGTTSLCGSLALHPDIVSPRDKELGFWDESDIRVAIPYYTRLLDSASNIIYKSREKHDDREYSNKITYDCTPRYVWSRPVSLPQELYDLNPNTKIIIIMRHPTDRLYSLYHHETLRMARQFSPTLFEQHVHQAMAILQRCFKKTSLLHCVLINDKKTITMNYVLYSLYAVYVQLWLDVFPRNQILFLKAEDYYSDVAGTLEEICKFLDISEVTSGLLRQIVDFQKGYTPEGMGDFVRRTVHADLTRLNRSMVHEARDQWYHYRETLSDETRADLDRFYQPFNAQLASVLNDRRFLFER